MRHINLLDRYYTLQLHLERTIFEPRNTTAYCKHNISKLCTVTYCCPMVLIKAIKSGHKTYSDFFSTTIELDGMLFNIPNEYFIVLNKKDETHCL